MLGSKQHQTANISLFKMCNTVQNIHTFKIFPKKKKKSRLNNFFIVVQIKANKVVKRSSSQSQKYLQDLNSFRLKGNI